MTQIDYTSIFQCKNIFRNMLKKVVLVILIVLIFNQALFCECARKIRYHKARNIQRTASAQIPFNFDGFSGGEGGDVFGFLSYYRPKDDIDLLRIGEDFRAGRGEQDYEFSGDDIIPEYDEDPIPNTTPRNNLTWTSYKPKPTKVRITNS